jgi:hypothetical protein
VGASVAVQVEDRVIRRLTKGGGSYLSTQDPRLLIGLGSASRVDRVVVHWPNGAHSTLTNPSLRQTHRIIEPEVPSRPDVNAGPAPGKGAPTGFIIPNQYPDAMHCIACLGIVDPFSPFSDGGFLS